jgi:hypothetical protein
MELMFQGVSMGALPSLRAACDPEAQSGEYYGPGGFIGALGPPVKTKSSAQSHDQAVARELWTISENFTGVTFGEL